MPEEKQKRRLVIRSFDVQKVEVGDSTRYHEHTLTIDPNYEVELPYVKEMRVTVLPPGELDRQVDNIIDVVPISAKVLGKIGEGITHTLTGCYVLVTGRDEKGDSLAAFGSAAGNLKEQMTLGRRGTPAPDDWILLVEVTVTADTYDRAHVHAAFEAADRFIAPIRELVRKLNGATCDEKKEFYDIERPGKPKVVVIQEVSGQGAMYESTVLPPEPSGFGGLPLLDMHNMPILLTPNEYRDGALRALM